MKSSRLRLAIVAVALLATLPLAAQALLSGNWTVHATAYLPEAQTPCEFEGTLQLAPDTEGWTGPITLHLLSGPEGCPAEMTAECSANLDGDSVGGTLTSAEFGMADFTGTLTGVAEMEGTLQGGGQLPRHGEAAVTPDDPPQGGFHTNTGQFEGVGGTWVAARQSVLEIPALTGTGAILLTLLLLAAASLLLVRRRHAAS